MPKSNQGVKVRDSSPPASTKGYRNAMPGACRSNAKDPGFPKGEHPWPEEKRKK